MAIAEFSVVPLGTGHTSLSQYVVECQQQVRDSGLKYQLTPMGTIIEGEWAEAMAVVTACFEALKTDCPRISTQIKVDYRAGQENRMKSKIEAVENHLGRKLST